MSDIDNTTPGSTTPATFGVTTDQPDYAPGSTATFTATGVTVGGSVEFAVADDPANPGDDGDVDVYKRFIITDGGDGDLDGQANGTVVAQWQVPATGDATNATLDLQVTDVSTGSTAETTFTDAAGSTNKVYQHWADAGTPEWNNNILNDAKSDYFEGDVIPHIYVYKASNQVPLVNGQSYSFNITYNYYQANTNAGGFDYITTYNLSRTPGPNDATNPFIAPSADGSFVNGGGTQGVFYTVDANITNVSGVTYTGTTTKDGHVTVTFTYTGTTTSNGIAEIFFGLHVAQPGGVPDQGAGPTDGANAWTGGSLQTTVDIGGSGATSIQLAPAAIIAGEISGIKFNDVDGDGVHDAGEAGLAGWTIFIDSNNNGQLDAGEASTVTDATGAYSFSVTPDADKSDVDNDPYIIREVNQAGWTHTSADPAPILITAADPTETNVNFGNQQQNPALNITKDASVPGGTADAAGEVISYTITVQNTGNVTLTGVTVTDPYADAGSIVRGADVVGDNDALLEVGETWGYTAAHTVTQAEIDSNGGGNGQLENTATADSDQTGPDTDDASVPVAQNPSLNITKDASVPGGTADAAGEVISYTITVQNTGNTTLTGVTVSDPFADAGSIVRGADVVGDNDALLEVGETWGYTAAHTVTQAEIDSNGGGDGLLQNTATADSNETGPDTDDASVPVAQNPALNITKDASVPGGTADAAGEVISYTITVANTGNTTLTGVTVSDPFADAGSIVRGADVVGDNDALLEVGETWGFTAAHTVTQAEIDSNGGGDGLLQNTATADSNETGPDTDDASVPVAQNPALNITKDASVPGGTADAAGEVISYTITVANTGNTTLTGVTVSDPFADPGSIVRGADLVGDNDALLEVGETWGYTAAHTVTQAEIDSNGGGDGLLENTATADSNETGPDTDDASVPVEQRASLNITKDASVPGGTADAAGEVISYTITVQNTGNTTLTGVTVGDPFADPGSIVRGADLVGDNDALLEVGETWGYTAAHTVTQAEIDSNGGGDGLLENTATADSNETGPDTDDASVPVEQRPGLNIVKDVSSVTDGPDAFPGAVVNGAGDVIHYAITVQNTGNVTLTGVTVTDPYADAGSIVRGADVVGDNDALLEVGETWSYTAAHTVLQAEIDSNGGGDGQLENTATADSNETGPDTDDASVPVVFNPGVNIDKTATIADGHADQAGDIINYTVVVTNTGNVTLNNVQVTDSFEGAANVVLTNSNSFDAALHTGNTFNDPNGNGVLDVGETWTYTYQHVVTQNELDTKGVDGDGSLDNAATVTTTSPDLGPLQDDASIPILLGPGVRTPGFWAQTNWQKFWDGIVGNEPSQAGTNGFADGEITLAVVNSLGDHRVDSNGDHLITAADSATGGKITKGLLIGDLNLNGVEDGGEHAFFISTSDALSLLNANTKQLQNAEYQEGRALVATWLNYLAGNPIEAGNPAAVDAKDAIQWGVDWLLKTTKQTDGSISLTDMNANALTASSTEWNVGIDGPDAGTAPTAYATIPQYNASLDIPGGVQILGVLDEYNNHGTVYGTPIATA